MGFKMLKVKYYVIPLMGLMSVQNIKIEGLQTS